MTIAIIYGGKSSEHEISIRSASSITHNLAKTTNTIILIGINKKGLWFLQSNEQVDKLKNNSDTLLTIEEIPSNIIFVKPGGGSDEAFNCAGNSIPVDVVFPVLHGSFGEDGTIQGLLEMANLPYVGGGVLASAMAMDKAIAKTLWQAALLPTLPFLAIKQQDWKLETIRNQIFTKIEKDFEYPVFIKPSNAGSSVGAGKAKNREEVIKQTNVAFLWDNKVIIEPFILAREIECSVTGNQKPIAYTPGEIIPSHDFYDYEAKYINPKGASLKIPAEIDEQTTKKIRNLAIKAYQSLELTGFSRVDFFIDKKDNNLYLNEINTIPGFTSISMFPKMCEASGLQFPELVLTLINLAIERFEQKQTLKTSKS